METININGKVYVEQVPDGEKEHVCVIADRGWIFEGYMEKGGPYALTGAHVVRRWDNGLGIGGLADPEHKDDYTLDELGSITVLDHAVIGVIPLRW